MYNNIKYRLIRVSIEQFATLFVPESEHVALDITVPVKSNYDNRQFALGVNIKFNENGRTFMIAEVFCHYEISKASWDELSEHATKAVIFPKEFTEGLVRIAVGTARGVICAKTENTPYSKYFLPIIEIKWDDSETVTIAKPSSIE